MKKASLYFLIAILFATTPICFFGALGKSLTQKYEVDEMLKDCKDNIEKFDQLNKKHNQLNIEIATLFCTGIITSLVASYLFVKRKKILIHSS